MKFSNLAVLAVVAPLAAGFTTTSNQRQFAPKNVAFVPSSARTTTQRGAMSMDLSDLEKRLLEPKPEKKVKAEKPKPEKKAPKKKEPEPVPAPAPAPAPTGKKGKVTYDLGGVDVPKPKKEAPAPKPKVEKPKPAPKPKAEKPKPVPKAPKAPKEPKAPAAKDPNAVPAGVALGAAPLVLAPIALLGAGRGLLSSTKERREKIQQEIAEFEAAKQKKQLQAEVDGTGVVSALVRFVDPTFSNRPMFTKSLTLFF